MKIKTVSFVFLSSVVLSACMTQPPAQVVAKGNNFYGAPNATPMRYAAAPPARVTAMPVHKPQATSAVAAAPAAPVVQVAAVEPRPSYGFTPSDSTFAVRERGDVSQVTVRELEPLTAMKAEKPAEPVMAAATPAAVSPVVEPVAVQTPVAPEPVMAAAAPAPVAAEVLPEPQARVVAESKTVSSVSAGASSFIWPVKGQVISNFGPKAGGEYNDGVNIAAHEGEPIIAAADGEVVYSGDELRGYGNMVILRHDNGLMTAYAHADRILVSRGERVRQGGTIATVGKSGGVERAQLHFGVRKDKSPVDPMQYLSKSSLASR